MRQPIYLQNLAQLEKWLERSNPLQGLTMASLASTLQDAEEGRFAGTMWLLRKMLRRDETVRACSRRIYATLMKLDWRVKVMDTLPDGVTEAMAKRQMEALRKQYEQVENLKAACAALAMADLYSFAHAEKHYDAKGNVVRLQPVPHYHWWRDGISGPWKYNAKGKEYPGLGDLVDIEPVHFVTRTVDDPWYEIALIRGLRANIGDRDYDGFVARYGVPSTFFTAPMGASQDDVDEYQSTVDSMVSDGGGVLPNGATVTTFESQQKGEIMDAYIKRQQSAIVLAATGGLLTMLTESGSGTLAGGAHSDTWRELVSGIASEVSEAFQEQMDKPLLAERFPGQPVAAYFELEFPEEGTDTKVLIENITSLKAAGFSVQADWVAEETAIPVTLVAPVSAPGVPPLTNRRAGIDAEPGAADLAAQAVADLLDVEAELLAPMSARWRDLAERAERLSPAQILKEAQALHDALPELMTATSVEALAAVMERALTGGALLARV